MSVVTRPKIAAARALAVNAGTGCSLPPWLFDDSGGVQVSGDSGSGKSTFLCGVMALLARRGFGFSCFDPHGDLVQKVKRICLSMGDSVTRRLYEISPGDTSLVTKFNPLAVDRAGHEEYRSRAMLIEKCGHAARILLHAWGERDFNSKPLLYKWVNRVLAAAALLGLPFAAVRHFLEVGSPLYQSLTAALPDFLARLEFAELEEMRPRDREEVIASTKNRFLGFLSNPVVEAALSCNGGLCAESLIQHSAIILVDLSQQNVLREEDQEIFANLWLSEILHAVFGMPEKQRVPHWVIIDELPVFASSAPLITKVLRQVRKYRARFVCAHNGVNFFEKQTEDQLLHALVGQCGVHFFFRHIDPMDAAFFAQILSLPSYFSPTKAKHVLRQKQQYQAGHEVVTLTDRSETTTEGEDSGGSQAQGRMETESSGQDFSQTTTHTTNEGGSPDRGASGATATGEAHRASLGRSSGSTQTMTNTWSRSLSASKGRTWKQSLVPVLKWRDIVTSVAFLTPEEQTMGTAAVLSRLLTGEALLYVGGHGVRKVRIPLLNDPFALTRRFADKKLAEFRKRLLQRSAYEESSAIPALQEALIQACLDRLSTLAAGEAKGNTGTSDQRLLSQHGANSADASPGTGQRIPENAYVLASPLTI